MQLPQENRGLRATDCPLATRPRPRPPCWVRKTGSERLPGLLHPLPLCCLRTTQSIHLPRDQVLLPTAWSGMFPRAIPEGILADLPFHGSLTFVFRKLSGYVFLVIILASKIHWAGGGLGPLPWHPSNCPGKKTEKRSGHGSSKVK